MDIFGKSHYDLDEIKRLLQNPETRVITDTAQKKAFSLGYASDEDIVNRCMRLERRELFKTMTTDKDHKLWQDVYYTFDQKTKLYIKLQINKQNDGVVVSFKNADE